jgi:hypothetical protein
MPGTTPASIHPARMLALVLGASVAAFAIASCSIRPRRARWVPWS